MTIPRNLSTLAPYVSTTGVLSVAGGGSGVATSTGTGSLVLSTSPVLETPNLGTPTSLTLTSATGLPVSSGISGLGTGVATALGVAVNTTGGLNTIDGVATIKNKRVEPRVQSQTITASSVTWNSNNYDQINLTLSVASTTIALDSGSPTDGQKVMFRVRDDGTVRSFTLTAAGNKCFRPVGLTLPTSTTTANKLTYIGCIYNSTGTGTWDVVATGTEA